MLSARRSDQSPSDVDQGSEQSPSKIGSEKPLDQLASEKPLRQSTSGSLEHLTVPPRPTVVDNDIEEPTSNPEPQDAKTGNSPQSSENKKRSTSSSKGESPLQPKLFVENLREGIAIIVEGVQGFIRDKEISTTRKVLTIGGCAATVFGASLHSISSGMGALCLVVSKLGDNLTENKHNRPYSAIGASVLTAHYTSAENEAMAVNSEVYACRMVLQSMIPESRTLTNIAVTAIGVGISSFLFCCSPGFSPEVSFQNAPLLVTVLHGFGSSLSSDKSGTTRLLGVACSSMMISYHCMVSGSAFLGTLSALWLYGSCKNILRKDIPEWRGAATRDALEGPNTQREAA